MVPRCETREIAPHTHTRRTPISLSQVPLSQPVMLTICPKVPQMSSRAISRP